MNIKFNDKALRQLFEQRAKATQAVLNSTAHDTADQPVDQAAGTLRQRLAKVDVDMPLDKCTELLTKLRAGEDVRIDFGG